MTGATLPIPRAPRYDSLDLWRGVACLLVLVNHAIFYNLPESTSATFFERLDLAIAAVAGRLWLGVPIFFVISGYCISATADSHRRKGTSVRTYFLRRFRRIFPPFWVVLLTTAVVVGVADVALKGAIVADRQFLRPWWFSSWQWAGSITLTETWRAHLIGDPKALFLGHAWTLCYEEQFYAVCGILLFLWPRRYFLAAAVVTAAVAAIALTAASLRLPIDGFFFDGGWLQFALGILLYYALNYGTRRGQTAAAAFFGLVVIAAASYGSALLDVQKNAPQQFFTAGLFGLAALVLRPFDSKLLNLPILGPLRSCGTMCYSLYLVHLPVVDLIRAGLRTAGVVPDGLSPFISLPLCGGPAIWVAWQFHLMVERRFMNAPPLAKPRPVATSLVPA
jgi:peptidoglycan/LPS O-acetylase OafA/YrhL